MSELQRLLTENIAQDHTLTSIYEVEDILLVIEEIGQKVEYYKGLKKHRVGSIDDKISELSAREGALRQVIFNTMLKIAPKDKTLNFPSIGKVSRRVTKESWMVADEDQVLDFLENNGVSREDVTRVTKNIDKRKMKDALDLHLKNGDKVPGTELVPSKESLSITFEKKDSSGSSPKKKVLEENVDLDVLDALAL